MPNHGSAYLPESPTRPTKRAEVRVGRGIVTHPPRFAVRFEYRKADIGLALDFESDEFF